MTDNERNLVLYISKRLEALYGEFNNPEVVRTLKRLRGKVERETKPQDADARTEPAEPEKAQPETTARLTDAEVEALAESTSDAYSYAAYGAESWAACVRELDVRGYDARQIEAILRSKWTRWASDASNARYGKVQARHLLRFLDQYGYSPKHKEVASLTRETFAGR